MATKKQSEEPKLTMAEIAKLFDEKMKEAHKEWEAEAAARTEAEKAKAVAEVEANVNLSIADDKARMAEASKQTCMLRGPFHDYVSMGAGQYWVDIPDGEEQEVPQWVAYIVNQSKEANTEIARKQARIEELLRQRKSPSTGGAATNFS